MNLWWKISWMDVHVFWSVHWCFKEKYFKSHENKWSPLSASEMMLLRSIFSSSRDASGDNVSPRKYSLSPTTVNLTRKGSDFKGCRSQKKLAYLNFWTAGTFYLLIKLIIFVAPMWPFNPLERLPRSFIPSIHHVELLYPDSKVSNVYFHPCLL